MNPKLLQEGGGRGGGGQDDICMVVVLQIDYFLFLKIQDAA